MARMVGDVGVQQVKPRGGERAIVRSFDRSVGEQLLLYAGDLGELLGKVQGLETAVAQREAQLRETAAGALRAQEEERQRIACEVHDRIAQILAAAFQQLQTLEGMARKNRPFRQVAVRASLLVREGIREARNIMNDLHPPVLEEFGLVPLMEEELRRFHEDSGCRVQFEGSCPVRLPRHIEVAVYRIFHEALINIRRHAQGATTVAVTLANGGEEAILQVQDDGPGFDVAAATRAKGVGGLMSMRRRAEVAGGRLEISSALGRGARVTLRVPVPVGSG